ncbi:DUF550 domain-containing protein [Salmonella enterica subsp. enterica serovar Glostrup]|uniref:DUF550 domain-containing protein n=1 Tax=Salmonella enterica TaxID=28901 RepID=A0A5U0QPT4_SALER|nr:DUF550 domain-containing protein [Salmonella enterica]EBV0540614.1 DUF550 domain-containing protein [Salmonella enterica subsp. enterica serovar Glostrup]
MTTITKEWLQQTIAEFENTRDDIPFGLSDDDAKILIVLKRALVSLDAEPVRYLNKFSGTCVTSEQQPNAADDVAVYVPLYTAPPASEREQIRREHAEWSDATFGDVGPIGPLKHLSKEALEAAAEPDDLSEWADMQFLLWDAQRRAGITDELITQAMIEKLAANKQREWPAPRDGEPRPHIKDMPAPEENGLLPCPFCGGKAHQLTIERDDDPHFGGDVITCTECGASSHVEFGFKENLKSAWNSRAAMFRDLSQPVDPQISEYERIMLQAGNSPVIPEGYALVPVEPTDEMIEAAMNCEDVLFNSDESFCVQFGNIYEAMLAAAPQPEISDGK